MSLLLRDYQRETVDAIYRYFESRSGNCLAILPCGAGKSVVCAAFLQEALLAWPDQRMLVLTHVRELVEQNAGKLFALWPEAPAGVYSAGLGLRQLGNPITFAGIQSVYRRARDLGHIDLILVDECHLCPPGDSGMYRTLLADLIAINPKLKVIGLTATPFRLGQGLLTEGEDRLFSDIAFEVPLSRLLGEGHLAPLTTRPVRERANLEAVRIKRGDFSAAELQDVMQAGGLVQRIVAETCSLASARKAWLVFATGVDHAVALRDTLCAAGIAAGVVTAATAAQERDGLIRRYRDGGLRALVNVGVLLVGFDAPHTDCIVMARPTLSPVLYLQMLGRGMRNAPGKENCLVLDFAGNVQRHGPADQVRPPRRKGVGGGEAPHRICDECGARMHASATYCGDCGKEFPRDALKKVSAQASTARVLSTADSIEPLDVIRVVLSRHHKPGSRPSLRVDYYAGICRAVSEWVCFEHTGYARTKAIAWWNARTDTGAAPHTVAEALARQNELRTPDQITVSYLEKWPRVLRARIPAAQAMEETA